MSSKNRKKRKAAYKAKQAERSEKAVERGQKEGRASNGYKLSEVKKIKEDEGLESYMQERDAKRRRGTFLTDEIAEVAAMADAALVAGVEGKPCCARSEHGLGCMCRERLKRDRLENNTSEAIEYEGKVEECPRCHEVAALRHTEVRASSSTAEYVGKACPRCSSELLSGAELKAKYRSSRESITPLMERALDQLNKQDGPMDGNIDENDDYTWAYGQSGEIIGFATEAQITQVGNDDDLPSWSNSNASGVAEDFGKVADAMNSVDTDDEEEIKCQECKKELVDCECYESQCEFCGDDDPDFDCDCCPTLAHNSYLDDDCTCMTDADKFDRMWLQDENQRKKKKDKMITLNISGTNPPTTEKDTLPVQQLPAAPPSDAKGWCKEHQRDYQYCGELAHFLAYNPNDKTSGPVTGWCMEHRSAASLCIKQPHIGWCKQHNQTIEGCKTMWHAPSGTNLANGVGSGVVLCQSTHLPAADCKCSTHSNVTGTDGRSNANIPVNGQASLPGFQGPPAQSGPPPSPNQGSKTTDYVYERHSHAPQMVIDGKTWSIWCGNGDSFEDNVAQCNDEFDLLINLTGRSIKGRDRHIIPIASMKRWETGPIKTPEMILDWPDFGVIQWPLEFWLELLAHIEKEEMTVGVFCVGGHGRTGTAVCAMLIVGLNYTATEAVHWLRKNYCKKVVESKSQIDYLYDLEDAMIDYNESLKKAEAEKVAADLNAATAEVSN